MEIEVIGTGRIKKRKPIVYEIDNNGCWICTSHYIDHDGYPTICCNWRQRKMSRYIYQRFKGEIGPGLVVRHKCDNRRCINPEHLELGTPKDNTNDMVERGRDKKACGEKNGSAKLTKDAVIKIRQDSRKNSQIAKEYGVTRECIRDIKYYKIWKSV